MGESTPSIRREPWLLLSLLVFLFVFVLPFILQLWQKVKMVPPYLA